MRSTEFTRKPRKLVIFDIDDTLVHTQTKVKVVKDGKVVHELNSQQFTHYKLKPGEEFDFGAFRSARDFFHHSQPIVPMIKQLRDDIATGNRVAMVTARADFDDKETFLKTFEKWNVDMNRVHVYRAGNITDPIGIHDKKKIIIRKLLNSEDFTKAIMYDDSVPNLKSFLELKSEYPDTSFYAWHVEHSGHTREIARAKE
jgi:hypothetical protein